MSDRAHEPLILNCKGLQREIEQDPFLSRAVKDEYIRRLDALAASLSDPFLKEACHQVRPDCDRQASIGLDKLLAYFPPEARLSVLCDAGRLTEMFRTLEKGGPSGSPIKRNTVRRQVYRAVSKLLVRYLGRAEKARIFAEVEFPTEDDTREVYLPPEDLARLFGACARYGYDELALVVRTALYTGADRGVLLAGKSPDGSKRGLLVRDAAVWQEDDGGATRYSGELQLLHDEKATTRQRTVPIGDRLARELFLQCKGKSPDDLVFSISYQGLDHLWKRVRKEASLTGLRFKDLRAQFSIYAERAGIPLTVVAAHMGPSDQRTTRRYQRHAAVMTTDQVDAVEREMAAA